MAAYLSPVLESSEVGPVACESAAFEIVALVTPTLKRVVALPGRSGSQLRRIRLLDVVVLIGEVGTATADILLPAAVSSSRYADALPSERLAYKGSEGDFHFGAFVSIPTACPLDCSFFSLPLDRPCRGRTVPNLRERCQPGDRSIRRGVLD